MLSIGGTMPHGRERVERARPRRLSAPIGDHHEDRRGSAHALLRLQELAGNTAAVLAVQRQVVTEEAPSSETATGVQEHPTLRIGSRGEDVKTLQMKLLNVGLRDNDRDEDGQARIDGIFGPLTREDVLAFQEANGLAADGIVGPKTWSALDNFTPQTPDETRVRADQATFDEGVRLRQAGQYEEAIPLFLAVIASPETTRPEINFAAEANLGVCHHHLGRLQQAIQHYEAALAGTFLEPEHRGFILEHVRLARIGRTPDEELIESPEEEGGGITARPELLLGSFGEGVERLQIKLCALRFRFVNTHGITGVFDETTESQLRNFQTFAGLDVTGTANMKTWHALDTYAPVDRDRATVESDASRYSTGVALQRAGHHEQAITMFESLLGPDYTPEQLSGVEYRTGLSHHHLGRFQTAIPHYEEVFNVRHSRPGELAATHNRIREARTGQPPS